MSRMYDDAINLLTEIEDAADKLLELGIGDDDFVGYLYQIAGIANALVGHVTDMAYGAAEFKLDVPDHRSTMGR